MVDQSAGAATQANRIGQLSTALGGDALLLLSMTCTERLSHPFLIVAEAVAAGAQPLHTLLGTHATIATASPEAGQDRFFSGIVWAYEELGATQRGTHYRLELRPTTHLMTLNRRNRIFQQQSAVDIVKSLLGGAPVDDHLSGTYAPLDYCVQYQESDWDFLSRLLEYEGIYYYHAHGQGTDRIVLIDDRNNHPDLVPASVPVVIHGGQTEGARVWDVTERRTLGPAKVTVDDYDFQAPATALLKTKAAAKVLGHPTDSNGTRGEGSADGWSDTAELYTFPAKYASTSTDTGEQRGAAWLDAHRRRMARSTAKAHLFAAAAGRRLSLAFPGGATTDYLLVATTHEYRAVDYQSGGGSEQLSATLELMPATEQYRPEHRTPRPVIPGPQTALVVGPSGDEIHTDQYGRIKVQFPWDREGKKDANSSCFIRVVQQGAGQGWGSFALPRIGQEVVVEFLDGDPDRPLVTGAVYNATNTVPETLPDNKTQFGMKSRITTGGGGFNRLWFEDKKGSEVVWFRAERDYKVNIVHQDETRVYDEGNRTTTFTKGNDTLTLDKGNLSTTVSQGDETRKVSTGKRTTTINSDETLEVTQGNRAATVKMGNDTLKVSMGDVTVDVTMGNHKTSAMQSIQLTCGGSSIKMDPMSISIEAPTVKINGSLLVEVKGLVIQSEATTMHVIKGLPVMIN